MQKCSTIFHTLTEDMCRSSFFTGLRKCAFKVSILVGLSVPLSGFAQNKGEIDSLVARLLVIRQPVTERADLLNTLGIKYAKTDSARAFSYAGDAKKLSEQLNYLHGQAMAQRVIGIALTQKNRIPAALSAFNKALQLYATAKKEKETGVIYSDIGTAYLAQNNRKEAIENFGKAEQLHRRFKDNVNLLTDLNQLGVAYFQGANNQEAIRYYLAASALADQLNDTQSRALIYSNLAQTLSENKNYPQAKDYFLKAIQLNKENNDQRNLGIATLNLANLYTVNSEYKQAEKFYNEALEAFKKSAFTKGIQVCNNNLGALALRQERFREALPYLNNSLEISKASKNYTGLALTQQNIAFAYTKLKEFDLAEKLFDEAERSAVLYKNNSSVFGEIYNHRSMLDSARGNYKEAFIQRNKYLSIKDSLLNEKLGRQINELQTQYETEKKERRIDVLSKENTLQSLNLKDQELQLYRNKLVISRERLTIDQNLLNLANQRLELNSKQNQLNKRQIESQQKDIVIARKSLNEASSNAQLARNKRILAGLGAALAALVLIIVLVSRNMRLQRKRLHAENELTAFKAGQELLNEKLRISSELHDNIGSQLTFIHSSLQHLRTHPGTGNQLVLKETEDLAVNTIRDLRETVWFINNTSFTTDEFVMRLRSYLKPYQTTGGTVIVISDEVPADVKLSSATATGLFRIIQEAINNAIKYSGASRIAISLYQDDSGNLMASVSDNGKGFNTALETPGFGLKNMQARAQKSGGHVRITSSPEKGTSINVSVPV